MRAPHRHEPWPLSASLGRTFPQDNTLAEALKARNLLAEFDTSSETQLAAPPPRGGKHSPPLHSQITRDII